MVWISGWELHTQMPAVVAMSLVPDECYDQTREEATHRFHQTQIGSRGKEGNHLLLH
jgi:hypothetical protein